jgi:hypothetical protein
MMDDRSISLPDKTKVHWLPKTYKNFLNRTSLLYGRTQSGKSVIIEEIMYLLKEHIPTVFVISPTNAANGTYTKIVPPHCIKKELDAEWLEKLLTRQKHSSEMYQNANKLEVLKPVFDVVSDDRASMLEKKAIKTAHDSIVFIDSSKMAFSNKKKQKARILADRDDMLKKLYKNTIRLNKVSLEKKSSLTKQQKAAVQFLDFNPNVLLIFDDCASTFKKLYKKTTAIKEIFYEGRWYNFTTIISAQDDKEIDSELRKNAIVSIFTTAQAATANFERASNGYPKHEKLRAKICTETIFKQDENDVKHFQKLVYMQGNGDPFKYTIADMYDEFRIGSDFLWELSDRAKETKGKIMQNPLFDRYVS